MNIFKDDLLKNKYFLMIVGVFCIVGLIFYLVQYNSVENQCKRKYQKATSYFSSGNKLQQKALDSSTERLIEKCIEEGNRQ
jgi:hypothetical protein